MVRRLYGLEDVTIEELNGYDDKNYHVQVSEQRVVHPRPETIFPGLKQPDPVFVTKQTACSVSTVCLRTGRMVSNPWWEESWPIFKPCA